MRSLVSTLNSCVNIFKLSHERLYVAKVVDEEQMSEEATTVAVAEGRGK